MPSNEINTIFMEGVDMTTNYVKANKDNVKMITELCNANVTRTTTVQLSNTDEYIVMIECSFFTWRKLKKVLPLGKKSITLHTTEES